MRTHEDQFLFLNEFIRHPLRVAAVQPSSEAFVNDLLAGISFEKDGVFVEYGAGTGVVSAEVCRRMSNGSFCVAVEPNKSFCDFLNSVDSRMRVICDFAENASEKILELYGPADVILAGLPFSLMSEGTISVILKEAKNLLVSDGELRLFFYAHSLLVPKVQRMLDSVFEAFSLTWTSVSWNNIPPMAVVRCLN